MVLEAKCFKLSPNPKAMYTNYYHIASVTDEKVHTFLCSAGSI